MSTIRLSIAAFADHYLADVPLERFEITDFDVLSRDFTEQDIKIGVKLIRGGAVDRVWRLLSFPVTVSQAAPQEVDGESGRPHGPMDASDILGETVCIYGDVSDPRFVKQLAGLIFLPLVSALLCMVFGYQIPFDTNDNFVE